MRDRPRQVLGRVGVCRLKKAVAVVEVTRGADLDARRMTMRGLGFRVVQDFVYV